MRNTRAEEGKSDVACVEFWHRTWVDAMILRIQLVKVSEVPALSYSALDPSHQLLDFYFLLASQRQEWQTRRASIVAVEVHGVLHTGDAEIANHSLSGEFHALLFFAGKPRVSIFESGKDFVARHGRRTGESEDRANSTKPERRFKLVSGSYHHLEANFLLACLQLSYHRDSAR